MSWLFRGLFFAFIAGAWVYSLRNSKSHWTRWYGFSCAMFLAVVPIWQAIERPTSDSFGFSDPLRWAVAAAWGASGAFMLIVLAAIRDSVLDAGTRQKLRVVVNGESEGVNAV